MTSCDPRCRMAEPSSVARPVSRGHLVCPQCAPAGGGGTLPAVAAVATQHRQHLARLGLDGLRDLRQRLLEELAAAVLGDAPRDHLARVAAMVAAVDRRMVEIAED